MPKKKPFVAQDLRVTLQRAGKKGLSKHLEQTHPTANSFKYFKGFEVKSLVKVAP